MYFVLFTNIHIFATNDPIGMKISNLQRKKPRQVYVIYVKTNNFLLR